MSNLPLKALVWSRALSAKSAFHLYTVRKDSENEDKFVVLYCRRHETAKLKKATGFPTVELAKQWAWNHYNEKMQPYVIPDSITDIANWFKAAKPEPTFNDYMTQLGCHFEEVCEMMVAIGGGDEDICIELTEKAEYIKGLTVPEKFIETQKVFIDELELLDALCDQIVTATGVAYMMGFDIEGALKEVIRSNNSKMVKGKFEYDENGKMKKGESYSAPDLTPFVKQGE